MTLLWIIYIACIIVWLLPPFRQYKTKYFPYFFALAIADPAKVALKTFLNVEIWQGHVMSTLSYIILLSSENKLRRIIPLLIIFFIIIFFFIPIIDKDSLFNFVAINFIIITAIITKDFFVNIKETEQINIFFLLMILYNMAGVMKVLFKSSFTGTGNIYYFVTNFFQIFIAVYFTLYNVNNAKKIRLFRDEQTT